jgi:hypothetical protein
MIDIEPLEKIIALALQSAYVNNNEKAVSLLLLADAEHGKTEALNKATNQLFKSKKIFYSNNITAKYVEKNLMHSIEKGEIRHIVIPDILNCIERGRSTRKLFLNFMKSLIEEGIVHIADAYGDFKAEHKVRCGLITAITKNNMKENFFEWRNIGFLSRVVTFSYSYNFAKVIKIIDSFLKETGSEPSIYKISTTDETIADSEELYSPLKTFALTEARKIEGLGLRLYKNLIYLARSNAKLNKRKKVTPEDITEILRLTAWINLNYNAL